MAQFLVLNIGTFSHKQTHGTFCETDSSEYLTSESEHYATSESETDTPRRFQPQPPSTPKPPSPPPSTRQKTPSPKPRTPSPKPRTPTPESVDQSASPEPVRDDTRNGRVLPPMDDKIKEEFENFIDTRWRYSTLSLVLDVPFVAGYKKTGCHNTVRSLTLWRLWSLRCRNIHCTVETLEYDHSRVWSDLAVIESWP